MKDVGNLNLRIAPNSRVYEELISYEMTDNAAAGPCQIVEQLYCCMTFVVCIMKIFSGWWG